MSDNSIASKPMTDLERLRHSTAHILATAILRIWPQAQFAAGPPVENGFYYDLGLDHRITPEDFIRIEAGMRKGIAENQPFERISVDRNQALDLARQGALAALRPRDVPRKYKLDILQRVRDDEEITLYLKDDFTHR